MSAWVSETCKWNISDLQKERRRAEERQPLTNQVAEARQVRMPLYSGSLGLWQQI